MKQVQWLERMTHLQSPTGTPYAQLIESTPRELPWLKFAPHPQGQPCQPDAKRHSRVVSTFHEDGTFRDV